MKKLLLQLALLLTIPLLSNGQSNWERVESLPATAMTDLIVKNDTLWTASENIVYVSYDGGTSWAYTGPVAPNVQEVYTLHAKSNTVYAGTLGQGIFVSQNDGFHWQAYNEGLAGNALHIVDIAEKGDTLFIGTSGAGVYFRVKNGLRWQPYNENLGDRIAYSVNTLLATKDKLYLGTGAHGYLYHRAGGDANWTGVPIANPFISGLTAQSFVEINGSILAATALGIYRSTNQGKSWQRFGFGFNPNDYGAGDYRLSKTGQTLYLSINVIDYGFHFFQSKDGGENWYYLESFVAGFGYAAGRSGKYIYLASEFGMLRTEADVVSDDNEVNNPHQHDMLINTVFPNPAREQFNISLTLQKGSFVTARIFNALGAEVAVLHADQLAAGQHTLTWNNTNLPAGTYQLLVQTPQSLETRQLIKIN
ncbi:MAG: T9SS type A sorting domain-containing protein [Saprospiraceae bacterium]